MEINQTILEEAFDVIRQEGILGLTEQDLTSRLKITEAAFEEFFQNKNGLLLQVFQFEFETRKQEHRRIFATNSNPVSKLLGVVKLGLDDLSKYKAPVLQEVQENYLAVWNKWWSQSSEYTNHMLHDLLNDGVLSGDLRRDLNLGLVVKIMMEQLNILVNPTIFPQDRYNIAEVFRSIFLYYIRGLCTEQGMIQADSFFAKLR